MFDFNDEPIQKPDQDVFGIDPLAKAISDCIRQMDNPVGCVVAINGAWGSGKSSLINLVRYHLSLKEPDLTVVEFQSWLYRTESDLVAAFFRELYSALKPALVRSGKTFSKLGAIVAGAGSMAVTTGEPTAVVTGKALKLATGTLQKYIESGDDTTQLQQRVRKKLDKQPRKFLVVVDDLDRLSPDQALTVFRLIKSVGRLPKVMYVLAFDRVTTERAVADLFPSEGPHYLEKIVQSGFELPPISISLLDSMLRKRLNEIFSDFEPDATYRSHELYRDGVLSEIRTVRDVKRLTGMLSVTWGAVRGEVDDVDFLSIETLRLFRPHVYNAVRNNKQLLVGGEPGLARFAADRTETSASPFLNHENEDQRERLHSVLLNLFPPITSTLSGIPNRSEESERSRKRRVCAREHFDTYFRFSLPPEAVSRHEVEDFVRRATDKENVKDVFHNWLEVVGSEERTKASYLLEALNRHSGDFSVSSIGPFLAGLFEMADALMDKGDEAGWARLTNFDRIRFLVDALVKRVELQERPEMLREACQNASLGWLTHLTTIVERQHQPTNDEAPVDQPLTTKEDIAEMQQENLRRIRRAANGNDLLAVHDLKWVLYRWHDLAGDNATEAREWTTETMESDQGVAALAQAFLDETRNLIAGDSAPLQEDRAKIEHIEAVLDRDLFHKRLCEARSSDYLSADQRKTITRLLHAWKKHEQNA